MTRLDSQLQDAALKADVRTVRNILVVDDSRAQRLLLASGLKRLGYRVLQAESGVDALKVVETNEIDLILSDWMMPGMTGVEFCRALRARELDRYVYFILLTSKAEKSAVTEGLDVGADDFLIKPVDSGELHARIRAGERLLAMERALRTQNTLTQHTLAQLQALYDTLDNDLLQARKLQLSLLRETQRHLPGGVCSMYLRPSGHVGGDLVGCFDMDPTNLAIFSLDVSGHGVSSALLTARLAAVLSGSEPDRCVAFGRRGSQIVPRSPDEIACDLNRQMLREIDTDHYFTLGFAQIDQSSGQVRMVQAGHPHPLVQHLDGSVSVIGAGGLPVGLFNEARWETLEAKLHPGERLIWVSDGMTECPDPIGTELGTEGLCDLITRHRGLRGHALIEALIWELTRWAGTEDLPDDVSCVIFEFDRMARP